MLHTDHIMTLLATTGIGPGTVRHLIGATSAEEPQSLDDLLAALATLRHERARTPAPSRAGLEAGAVQAAITRERAMREGILILGQGDPAFPSSLRIIPDAPVLLYAKGATAALALAAVAVIGTREPTQFGLAAASRIAGFVAERGHAVVSGLAAGCDSAAHEGCLAAGGAAVAALAHGLDMVYPAQNRGLAERILATGGCLVSEYAPGIRPQRQAFVERDRLQSGLSRAVIVIETNIQGGTMHTVRFCLEQGRRLGCVDHPAHLADEPQVQGNRHLIAAGKATALGDRHALERFLARGGDGTTSDPDADVQLPLF